MASQALKKRGMSLWEAFNAFDSDDNSVLRFSSAPHSLSYSLRIGLMCSQPAVATLGPPHRIGLAERTNRSGAVQQTTHRPIPNGPYIVAALTAARIDRERLTPQPSVCRWRICMRR